MHGTVAGRQRGIVEPQAAAEQIPPREPRMTVEIDMTKETKQPEPAKPQPTEVPDAALDKAAGGLNPQPLPPRWGGKGN